MTEPAWVTLAFGLNGNDMFGPRLPEVHRHVFAALDGGADLGGFWLIDLRAALFLESRIDRHRGWDPTPERLVLIERLAAEIRARGVVLERDRPIK